MMKKLFSVLLALFMMAGVIAAAPVVANAAEYTVGNAGTLGAALTAAGNNTIKLTADITYPLSPDIENKTVTIDLNGYTLTFSSGLVVMNGELKLKNPTNGALNLSRNSNDDYTLGVINGKAEITNVGANGPDMWTIYANQAEVVVHGNLACNGVPSMSTCYAVSGTGSKITVNGTYTVAAGVKYALLNGTEKTQAQKESASSKAGYFEYKNGTSYLWVKNPDYVPPPPPGIFGTKPQYNQWWHYILFFLCFGFIWMWF